MSLSKREIEANTSFVSGLPQAARMRAPPCKDYLGRLSPAMDIWSCGRNAKGFTIRWPNANNRLAHLLIGLGIRNNNESIFQGNLETYQSIYFGLPKQATQIDSTTRVICSQHFLDFIVLLTLIC